MAPSVEERASAWRQTSEWARANPLSALIGVLLAGVVFAGAFTYANPSAATQVIDAITGQKVAAAMRKQAREEAATSVDDEIASIIFDARVRAGGARSVGRVLIYGLDDKSQLIAVEDVFESMDPLTEGTGIRKAPLPLDNISGTIAYMLQDPGNPRCIARNSDEYDDAPLREWLKRYGLKSSIACPIVVKTRLQGLVAISSRLPLERNPDMARVTRDAALKLTGYWARSQKVQAAIDRIQKTTDR